MKIKKLIKTLQVILLICFLIPLICHCYIGTFSRLTADDYCSAALYNTKGIIGGLVDTYATWSGRYTATFFDLFVSSLGTMITPYLPTIFLVIWLAVLAISIRQFDLLTLGGGTWLQSFVVSIIIIFISVSIAPNIAQSLYWRQGIDAYLPGLIFLTGLLGLSCYILRKEFKNKIQFFLYIPACFLLAILAGGNNDTMAAVQVVVLIVLLGLALLLFSGSRRKKATFLFSISLLGALAALALLFFAPGTRTRQAALPPTLDFMNLLRISFSGLIIFFDQIFSYFSRLFSVLILFVFSIISGFTLQGKNSLKSERTNKILIVITPLIVLIFLYVCFVPGSYALSKVVPQRVMIIPGYFLVIGIYIWGLLWGIRIRTISKELKINLPEFEKLIILGSTILIALFPLYISYKIINSQPLMKEYAVKWDSMNQKIIGAKKMGSSQVVVETLPDWAGLEGINENPDHWVNLCASDYYGITIIAKFKD